MSKTHAHRHQHPHPRGKEHHHPFTKRATKGRPPGKTAHEHKIWRRWLETPPGVATDSVKKIWLALHAWWPRISSLGIYNRRKIAGSSTWSQHAWGNADDVTDADTVKKNTYSQQMKEIVKWLTSAAHGLPVGRVIHGDASHQNHAHVEGAPERTGTPP